MTDAAYGPVASVGWGIAHPGDFDKDGKDHDDLGRRQMKTKTHKGGRCPPCWRRFFQMPWL
jgi:hypothetical protein